MNDVILSVPSLIGKPGDTVTVPILISNATEQDVVKDVVSLDLLLTYDPTLVSIVDPNPDTDENEAVRRAGISANWSIEGTPNPVVNLEEPRTIDLALIKNPNSPPTPDSDRILEIDFTIAENAEFGSSTAIDLQADEAQSRIGIGDQDSTIADESLRDGQIGVAELSIDDVSVAEGNEDDTEFTFTVSLSGGNPLDQPVTVDYTTEDGTAIAGDDYTATSGTLTFEPGEQDKTITVQVSGDTDFESDETFFVNLSNFSGGAIADAQGVGTITNDDVVVSIADVSLAEGNEGNTEFNFTVSLSEASNETVTVDYTTEDGTATAGEDYTTTSDTLTFEPGETTKNITVQVSGDTDFESDETFFVNLDNFTGGAIVNPQGIGTITNDDLVRVSNDLEIPADPFLPDGDDISGSLSDSDSSYTFDGQNFLYDFYALPDDNSVNPDNTLTITLTSDEFRPLLMILDSKGKVSDITFEQSLTDTTSSLNFTIPSDDPFFIISVESFDADGIGNYQLDII